MRLFNFLACLVAAKFNISDPSHVMVFLHIQKTGGTTFNRHLITDMRDLKCELTGNASRKYFQASCVRPNSQSTWLFSRYSMGWPCGIHADWTALHECVRSKMGRIDGRRPRKYYYLTNLRDPVQRFLSEWRHVQRNATWKSGFGNLIFLQI